MWTAQEGARAGLTCEKSVAGGCRKGTVKGCLLSHQCGILGIVTKNTSRPRLDVNPGRDALIGGHSRKSDPQEGSAERALQSLAAVAGVGPTGERSRPVFAG